MSDFLKNYWQLGVLENLVEEGKESLESTIRHGYSDTVKKLGFTSNELNERRGVARIQPQRLSDRSLVRRG